MKQTLKTCNGYVIANGKRYENPGNKQVMQCNGNLYIDGKPVHIEGENSNDNVNQAQYSWGDIIISVVVIIGISVVFSKWIG